MYYYLVVIVRRREKFCNSVGRRGNEKSSFSSSHLELSNAEMRFSADSPHNRRRVDGGGMCHLTNENSWSLGS